MEYLTYFTYQELPGANVSVACDVFPNVMCGETIVMYMTGRGTGFSSKTIREFANYDNSIIPRETLSRFVFRWGCQRRLKREVVLPLPYQIQHPSFEGEHNYMPRHNAP